VESAERRRDPGRRRVGDPPGQPVVGVHGREPYPAPGGQPGGGEQLLAVDADARRHVLGVIAEPGERGRVGGDVERRHDGEHDPLPDALAWQVRPDEGSTGAGHREHAGREPDPLPETLPADRGALARVALLPHRRPGEGGRGEPGALDRRRGRLGRPEQDGEGDDERGRGGGEQHGRRAAGERVPGHAAEQAKQVRQREQAGRSADRPRGGQQLLPPGDGGVGDRLERRQAHRARLADDPAEEQEREHARGHDEEQRQPGALAQVAERQAEQHPGRARRQVPVAAVGGTEADDADHGKREQREVVDQLVAAGHARRPRWSGGPRTPGRHGHAGHTFPAFSSIGRSVRARSASTVRPPDWLIPGGASGSQRSAITRTSGPK
jgi:hypothetical protein